MNRQRLALLLIAAAVAFGAAWYVSTQRSSTAPPPGLVLLPSLAKDVNTATAVLVRKGGATPALTMHRVGDRWSVAERADYPADLAKLRTLLLALRDAKIVEEKTSDPARFAVLGVEDPAASSAPGAEVTVVMPSGKTALIVGKTVGEGNYVRRPGEDRSFSVAPAITVETEPRFWIDASLVDVPVTLIQNVEFKPVAGAGAGAGAGYTLRRLNPADNTFTLDGVPAGRKALDGHALAPAASMLTGLNAEDVAPSGSVDFSHSSQVTVTQTDGTILTLKGVAVADKHWIEVTSSKDAALTAKTHGRVFEIPSYRYDAIFKPTEQLLEPMPAAAKPAAAKPVAAQPAAAKSGPPRPAKPAPAIPQPPAP